MVLAEKQKYRLMELDRKPRNKPMNLWSINLQQRRQEYTMERYTVFLDWKNRYYQNDYTTQSSLQI